MSGSCPTRGNIVGKVFVAASPTDLSEPSLAQHRVREQSFSYSFTSNSTSSADAVRRIASLMCAYGIHVIGKLSGAYETIDEPWTILS